MLHCRHIDLTIPSGDLFRISIGRKVNPIRYHIEFLRVLGVLKLN